MNCCKLRYMKILGGIKAVPEKPTLTNVTTRTPFMTICADACILWGERSQLRPVGPRRVRRAVDVVVVLRSVLRRCLSTLR